ncbi:hypothetical protein [Tumebacillus flagellatus]|uniref:Uncharacterized protein n=1 Tax=Tumebacillus flagellatus TaxID=1157490 RepID=A0A074LT69_9BACL|nr:hypothetical protein [Tumebacillus flagellatus]KEO83695.1 hypothetical protein EL26_08560 [Tumebacillus flagellatus]
MTLFEECVEALGESVTVLSHEDSRKVILRLQELFPITFYGRIDWDQVKQKVPVKTMGDIIDQVVDFESTVYLIWSDASFPVLKTELADMILNRDDVLCVSSDIWVLSVEEDYVIEFYHEGEVTVGLIG